MDLVKVDIVSLQSTQRIVASLKDMLAAEPATIRSLSHRTIYLGREHDVIPGCHLVQPSSGDFFTHSGRIDIRGIEEIDACIQRGDEMLASLIRVNRPFAPFPIAIAHTAETYSGYR
jgi:hypothetical protein